MLVLQVTSSAQGGSKRNEKRLKEKEKKKDKVKAAKAPEAKAKIREEVPKEAAIPRKVKRQAMEQKAALASQSKVKCLARMSSREVHCEIESDYQGYDHVVSCSYSKGWGAGVAGADSCGEHQVRNLVLCIYAEYFDREVKATVK